MVGARRSEVRVEGVGAVESRLERSGVGAVKSGVKGRRAPAADLGGSSAGVRRERFLVCRVLLTQQVQLRSLTHDHRVTAHHLPQGPQGPQGRGERMRRRWR